jgi:subtilisin family serine protease
MAKRSRSRARVLPMATRAPETTKPIFDSATSNIVPGEVLVQLDGNTAAQISASIPRGPSRGRALAAPSAFGVSALDRVLTQLKITSITQLHPPAPLASVAMDQAEPMASTYRLTFPPATPVETAVQQLARATGVQFAEPNRYRETYVVPNDPSFAAQWGLAKINCPAAWDRTTGLASIVVAVIDTGVDLDHPELAPLLLPGSDMVDLGPNPTPPPGFRFEGDFQGRDNNPQDEVGHGTHVAGTIACLSNNGTGVAGVTWNCRPLPVRVLARIVNIANANDVRGTGSAADIAAGIRWAVDNGARVLNLSLGGPVDTQVERDAIAYAVAHGAVVVAAMGNGGLGGPVSFPAAYPDVVAVGAIDQADQRAGFSQVGPHIDVVGPGVGVLSTVWDNGFTTMSGTSMATPHVAGVAALVLSCNSNLTGAQAADIVRQTARPLRNNPADPIPNPTYGFGCVDAQAAINRACPPRPSVPIVTCPRVSTIIRCTPSAPIVTCPRESVIISCPSVQVVSCPAPSRPITTCPRVSTIIRCGGPSNPIITCPQPSLTIRCPSGPICGIERPVGPGPLEAAGGWAQEQDPYGWGGEDWESYDPYASYGDKGCGA